MNAQEALEILNRGYVWKTEHRREVLEAEKVIEQLVDRATPKKPADIIYNTHGGLLMGKCPVCGRLVVAYNACPTNECRQAIDWTNESEQIAKGETR